MDEQDLIMTPDEEVAMILSSNKDDGPTTSKRARLISNNQASSSSQNDDEHCPYVPSQNRAIGHRRHIWDDSSDSDSLSSVDMEANVYPNVDAYLSSIPEFDVQEHNRIPFYMELLGDNAKEIRTDLPRSDSYTDEQMEVVKNNFILSQLDYLIRENFRRNEKSTRKEARRSSLIKPLATVAQKPGHKSE